MLELMAGDVLDQLEKKPFVVLDPLHGPVILTVRSAAPIGKLVNLLTDKIHKAVKFIFDSGSDQDPETVSAVRDTAVAMIEAGFFHLPFPLILIEDPFENSESRNFYLCEEIDRFVRVHLIQRIPRKIEGVDAKVPRYMVYPNPFEIDLSEPSDLFTVVGLEKRPVEPTYEKTIGEAIYSVKKFLVALNTENLEQEKVEGRPWKASLPKKYRHYAHTIIRIPDDDTPIHTGTGRGGAGVKRRKHLVRGFIWGKNTRPKEEQRWVKPYWRGAQEVEVKERTHYVVKAPRKIKTP